MTLFSKNTLKTTSIFSILITCAALTCLSACGHETKPSQVAPPTVLYQSVNVGPVTLTREVPGRVSPLRMAEVRP